MDSQVNIGICIECGDDLIVSDGQVYCLSCDASLDMGAPQECPRCGNGDMYDAPVKFCHSCGYDGIEDKDIILPTLNKSDEPQEIDFSGFDMPSITSWAEELAASGEKTVTGAPWPFSVYKPEPYQPFFDLVEDLKKWHITVEKCEDSPFNKAVSHLFGGLHGVNVTSVPKAIFNHIYIPEYAWGTKSGYVTLRHEATHAKDFYRFGIIPFILMQWLLPFGPSFTALLEYRAYAEGLRAEHEVYGNVLPSSTENIAKLLAGRGYKYCFPFPKVMKRLLDRVVAKLGKKNA